MKNKITVICETDQIAQMASCYLTDAYLLKAARPPIPDFQTTGLNYKLKINHSFREFFIGGV